MNRFNRNELIHIPLSGEVFMPQWRISINYIKYHNLNSSLKSNTLNFLRQPYFVQSWRYWMWFNLGAFHVYYLYDFLFASIPDIPCEYYATLLRRARFFVVARWPNSNNDETTFSRLPYQAMKIINFCLPLAIPFSSFPVPFWTGRGRAAMKRQHCRR